MKVVDNKGGGVLAKPVCYIRFTPELGLAGRKLLYATRMEMA
jgi:hypothetical protein